MTSAITDWLLALAALAIPVVTKLIGDKLAKNSNAQTIVSILEPLAKDAVAAIEQWNKKDGNGYDGETQKQNAVNWVRENMKDLGYNIDWDTAANAIERAYLEYKKGLV